MERIANDTFLKTIRIVLEEATFLSPVSGDATQLTQVLINLCVNARDAMPDGGTLVLAADDVVVDDRNDGAAPTPGRYVRIHAEDDGQGMAPEVLDRSFEPFYTTKTALRLDPWVGESVHVLPGRGGQWPPRSR